MLFFLAIAFAQTPDDIGLSAIKEHEVVFNEAATAMNEGDPVKCMHVLSKLEKEYLYLDMFLDLGYICAVAGSQLNAAEMLREELGPLYMPKSALDVHHAWMLRNDKRYEEALDVLIPESWETERHKQLGTTMQAVLFTDLGRWTEAWLLAASPHVDRKAQLHIAQQLRNQGMAYKARTLYDLACKGLENAQKMGCGSVMVIPD